MDVFELQARLTLDDRDYNSGLSKAKSAMSKVGSFATSIGKKIGKGIAVGGTAIAALGTSAMNAYGDFEQLEGGVKKLFGAVDATTVVDNAKQAFETAGMSANEYMETVTNFSASLISGLNGDTTKAASIANMAIQDMSDNANTFGTDIGSIQNAYQGFAKGNFSMLDNLKLGYGGTRDEMIRLINDSGVVDEKISSLDDISLDQMMLAIHKIQSEMDITGTTADESATTIKGSFNRVKTAWENLKVALGSGDSKEIGTAMENLGSSTLTAAQNSLPVVQSAIGSIGTTLKTGLVKATPEAINAATGLVTTTGQAISNTLDGVSTAIDQNAGSIPTAMGKVGESASNIVTSIVNVLSTIGEHSGEIIEGVIALIEPIGQALIDSLPSILTAISNVIIALAEALPGMATDLSSGITDIIQALSDTLPTTLPLIVQAVLGMLIAIANELPNMIDQLQAALKSLIQALIPTLIALMPVVLQGALQLFGALVQAIPSVSGQVMAKIHELLTQLIYQLILKVPEMLSTATELIMNIVTAIGSVIVSAKNKIGELIQAILTKIRSFFGQMAETGLSLINSIWNKLQSMTNTATQKIGEVVSAIVNGVKGAVSDMVSAGGDLVGGIWEGISGSLTWIKNKISGWVGNVTNFMKDLFGIASPSKVMRDEVGRWLPAGIAVGIEDNTGVVNKAMQDLGLSVSASQYISSVPVDVASANGGYVDNSSYNIYIDAKLDTDTDIRSLAQKINVELQKIQRNNKFQTV